MSEVARKEAFEMPNLGEDVLLAADVGGTYARIGIVRVGGETPLIEKFERYRCADYANLAVIFEEFLAANRGMRVRHGAIALAGAALDDNIINTNLPWPVSLTQIRRQIALDDLQVINDFTAVAHATNYVTERDVTSIAATSAPLQGPVLVVGPGTGLGAAVRIPTARSPVILSTEAGQSALTASTDLEIEVLKIFMRESSHVPTEHVLSGPGLANLYAALAQLRGAKVQPLTPREITDAAFAGSDSVATESLHVFCGWFGSEVGNLVLLYGAQGGVFLAGGILPQIKDFLIDSEFTARFRDKGAMSQVLQRVPVSLIENAQLGVLGAARWYLEQRRDRN